MHEPKPAASLNVRIPPATMAPFQRLVEGAGETSASITRQLVDRLCREAEALDMSEFSVKVQFQRHDVDWGGWNSEFVGTLTAEVKAPAAVEPILARLVFVLPEFWEAAKKNGPAEEQFRIDNANFLRLTNDRVGVTSSRTSRNVLSFRLIEGRWDGSLFFYSGPLSRAEVEARVTDALTGHFRATVQLHLLGHLPANRMLTEAELDAISYADAKRLASRR